MAVSLVSPTPAAAIDLPNPLDVLPNLDPTSYIVDGFKAIIMFIFGKDIDEIGRNLVNLLLAVPILTSKQAFPELNQYRSYITSAAWGILGLGLVTSSFRYWLSSYSSSGAYEGLIGFFRTAGAVAILMIFPIAFDQFSRFINAFTAWLVNNPIVHDGLDKGLVGTLSSAPLIGGGIAMIITIICVILAIILLIVKVVITSLLAVLYVASPLAIAIWPIEELSWAMRSLLQAIFGLLLFPVMWALCFGTFAVLSVDSLFPGNHGDTINAVLAPVITLASLIIAFRLPFKVLEMAMRAGITPGISRGLAVVNNVRSYRPSRIGTPV